MVEMLSSAADSSFPRQMKEQKIKTERVEWYSFLKAGHYLHLLCTEHKKDLFCGDEQEKMHTLTQ